MSVYSNFGGKVSVRYIRSYIEAGETAVGRRMSEAELAVLDRFEEISKRPVLMHQFMLQPGEMYFPLLLHDPPRPDRVRGFRGGRPPASFVAALARSAVDAAGPSACASVRGRERHRSGGWAHANVRLASIDLGSHRARNCREPGCCGRGAPHMKPAAFEYFAPRTVDHALDLLAEHGEEGKILAGGQSLVPAMNFRLARPAGLIDINRIAALDYVREEGGELCIGALARHARFEAPAAGGALAAFLPRVAHHIAHVPIRSRGTFCGSVAHADPASGVWWRRPSTRK